MPIGDRGGSVAGESVRAAGSGRPVLRRFSLVRVPLYLALTDAEARGDTSYGAAQSPPRVGVPVEH